METTMTLSQLADLIIVCTFVSICIIGISLVSICIIGISHVIADLIFLIVSSIKKMLAKHKERPEEQPGDEKN